MAYFSQFRENEVGGRQTVLAEVAHDGGMRQKSARY